MKGIQELAYMITATIIVTIGLVIFLTRYGTFMSYIETVKDFSLNSSVIDDRAVFELGETVYGREYVIGMLLYELTHDVIIDGVLFSKDSFNVNEFNLWSIADKNYRKGIEYNVNGTIKYITFTGV